MKLAGFYLLAVSCILGLALADFNDVYGSMFGGGYGHGYGGSQVAFVPVTGAGARASGSTGFLPLIGLLFIIFFLFGFNNQNANQLILLNNTK